MKNIVRVRVRFVSANGTECREAQCEEKWRGEKILLAQNTKLDT
jgi:hypothetical protein